MNQTEFAAIGGVRKGAQINYEAGERDPDIEYLAAIATAGADIQYIITGVRSDNPPQPLPDADYQALIERVRAVMEDWSLDMADLAAEIGEKPKRLREALEGKQRLSVDVLLKLVQRFDLSADWLLRASGRMYHDPRPTERVSPMEKDLLVVYRELPPNLQNAVISMVVALVKNTRTGNA
ncbi:helix-turn-helix domain-containing protein [Methylocaldum gracile subsp. desertum]|uniref:helix-turn-helix domain-containing protein n=1 Tax=Methylocaldum sp. GT1BW TaxID=3438964 RepID=UPI003DA0B518